MGDPTNLTAWERWELASFDQTSPPRLSASATKEEIPQVRLPTAEEIERIHQQAREEGLQQGREEGYQAGYKEGQARANGEALRFEQLSAKLGRALDEMEAQVADELLTLAVSIAREVVRQELAANPEILLGVVREALAQLPHQHAAIYVHPDDASLLRSYLGDQLTHAGHRIHEDFKLKRGDCILEAGSTQVDASVAMRWQRVVENIGVSAAWQTQPVAVAKTAASDDET